MTDDIVTAVIGVIAPFMPEGSKVEANTELLELIDSAMMINILLALEERLNIRIDASDLTFDHFTTCSALARRLALKLRA
jgi:acyl carrier protein